MKEIINSLVRTIETNLNPIVITDSAGKILKFNKAFNEIYENIELVHSNHISYFLKENNDFVDTKHSYLSPLYAINYLRIADFINLKVQTILKEVKVENEIYRIYNIIPLIYKQNGYMGFDYKKDISFDDRIVSWSMNLESREFVFSKNANKILNIDFVENNGFHNWYKILGIIHEEDRKKIKKMFNNCASKGETIKHVFRSKFNDANKNFRIIAYPEYLNNKVIRINGMAEEITNKCIIDTEIEKLHDENIRIKRVIFLILSEIVESRDSETGEHILRTQKYFELLVKKLENDGYSGILNKNIYTMIDAAPLHDIGKVRIPDRILLKTDRLTDEEFEVIKTHPSYGAKVLEKASEEAGLKNSEFIKVAINIIKYHHEKYNGNGYPYGLKGEEIPIEGRIMAIVDAYDALRSVRPYKSAFSHERALEIIKEESGKHFDPVLVESLLKIDNDFLKVSNKRSK